FVVQLVGVELPHLLEVARALLGALRALGALEERLDELLVLSELSTQPIERFDGRAILRVEADQALIELLGHLVPLAALVEPRGPYHELAYRLLAPGGVARAHLARDAEEAVRELQGRDAEVDERLELRRGLFVPRALDELVEALIDHLVGDRPRGARRGAPDPLQPFHRLGGVARAPRRLLVEQHAHEALDRGAR